MTGYGIRTMRNNPTLEGMAAVVPDVVFSKRIGSGTENANYQAVER